MMGAIDPIRALLDTPSPTRAADDWGRFVETVISLRARRSGWPAELACARLWYEPHLERLHDDAITRRADLIQQIANGYPSRERFLTELTLDPPEATSDQSGAPLLAPLGATTRPKGSPGNGSFLTRRWREMDSNLWYRDTKAVDFRSIPSIAGIGGALKRYHLMVQPFFFCASNHSIEPGWGRV
jgi:hypothetical protein